jgi:hypothetical protein
MVLQILRLRLGPPLAAVQKARRRERHAVVGRASEKHNQSAFPRIASSELTVFVPHECFLHHRLWEAELGYLAGT